MSPKNAKMVGYGVTGLFSAMMCFGGAMQIMGGEQVLATFNHLGITNIMMMRFLGMMKIAGAVGMWVPKGRAWAVHGFTFLFCGALATHFGAGDAPGEFAGATIGLCLLGFSEWCAKKAGGGSMGGSMSSGGRRAA